MPRHQPERTCIVTREAGAPAGLIRFVVGPEGNVVPDLKGNLPGRGAWVTATAELVGRAARKGLFRRAFKAEVKASPTLPDEVDAALRRDLRQALSLANKAGVAVTGFAKVEAALAGGPVAALIHASDASADGRRKLSQKLDGVLRKRGSDAISSVPVVDCLSGEELDLAFGRSNVIHAALVAGAGSDGFLSRWRRLRDYRGGAGRAGLREEGGDDPFEPARFGPNE